MIILIFVVSTSGNLSHLIRKTNLVSEYILKQAAFE